MVVSQLAYETTDSLQPYIVLEGNQEKVWVDEVRLMRSGRGGHGHRDWSSTHTYPGSEDIEWTQQSQDPRNSGVHPPLALVRMNER